MSDFLCLVDHLIERARRLVGSFQFIPALELLKDVEAFPLSKLRAEEVQCLLGEIYLSLKRYRRAHRHFRKAVRLAPRTARYRHLLGICVASHPHGRLSHALKHFRHSMRLAPHYPASQAEAGLLNIRLGRVRTGLTWLRQAAARDVRLVEKLARGYCELGRPDEAQRAVQTAQFSHPDCPKLHQLYCDLQTRRLRGQQATLQADQDSAPVFLPFLRLRRG